MGQISFLTAGICADESEQQSCDIAKYYVTCLARFAATATYEIRYTGQVCLD